MLSNSQQEKGALTSGNGALPTESTATHPLIYGFGTFSNPIPFLGRLVWMSVVPCLLKEFAASADLRRTVNHRFGCSRASCRVPLRFQCYHTYLSRLRFRLATDFRGECDGRAERERRSGSQVAIVLCQRLRTSRSDAVQTMTRRETYRCKTFDLEFGSSAISGGTTEL